MKLRIRGNSLRVRISQPELKQLASQGVAEDSVSFAAHSRLGYRVRVSDTRDLSAEFADGQITVFIPERAMSTWLEPEEVGLRGEQALAGSGPLKILVEKDFTCLAPREDEDEDESELFPNPALENR